MPLKRRYGKKKRYGRSQRRYKKRRFSGRRRRGKKVSKYISSIVKDSQAYTTIYKTAVRCTSRAGTCDYWVLDKDPYNVQWASKTIDGISLPYGGDMTCYGHGDIQQAFRNVQFDTFRKTQGVPSVDASFGKFDVNQSTTNGTAPTQAIFSYPSFDYKMAYGKMNYLLHIKSAITGANVKITLYKCRARYNIPKQSEWTGLRPLSSYLEVNALDGSISAVSQPAQSESRKVFQCPTSLHAAGWYNAMVNGSDTEFATGRRLWEQHQEGSTLYDNKLWCKIFKIVKSYNIELMPGQAANLRLQKKKITSVNMIQQFIQDSMSIDKGQIVFVLKVEGSVGHQTFDPNTQTAKFAGGAQSRPNIGLMPAAVDVLCFKKMKAFCKYMPQSKFKNILSVADYFDNGAETQAEGGDIDPGYFKDAAPSDYADSAAVIG